MLNSRGISDQYMTVVRGMNEFPAEADFNQRWGWGMGGFSTPTNLELPPHIFAAVGELKWRKWYGEFSLSKLLTW